MRNLKPLFFILFILTAITACFKIEQLPPKPFVEFTSFEVFDTLDPLDNITKAGKLIFRFEDGDGDLLLTDNSGIVRDTTHVYLTLFRKTGGTMVKVTKTDDPLLPHSTMSLPFLRREGPNQIQKGTIAVTFLYLSYKQDDTIKYNFIIIDRAKNISNLGETSEIIVSENKVYTNE